MKYKVNFNGFTYVEADSEDEAKELAQEEDYVIYLEWEYTDVEEVEEFGVVL